MDYNILAELYENLTATSKRLEKTYLISKFLKRIHKSDAENIVNLIQGQVFPTWEERKIGVNAKIVIKALSSSSGIDPDNINKELNKLGDLGLVAEKLVKTKTQSTLHSIKLTTKKVYENIRKLAELEGQGTINKKIGLISELLTSATPIEAKYIIRTLLEDMRIGVSEGTLRDALVWAYFGDKLGLKYNEKENDFIAPSRLKYDEYIEKVQIAYDLCSDYSIIIEKLIKHGEKGLDEIKLTIGKPINVMLYQKAKNIEEGFQIVGKPAIIEYKYDGFRVLVHKLDNKIILFTRRLENVTQQFPDIIEAVKKYVKGNNFILDGEVIGIDPKTKKWMPFQAISQRIKRKYDIEELTKKVPVMLNIFDIIAFEDKNLINKPLKERRILIEKIITPGKDILEPARQIITSDLKTAEEFYKESLDLGNEGIMMKNINSVYKPGSRVGFGIKVKPILETLDLVITGAEWGEGKRTSWLSSFELSCLSEDKKRLLTIGKVGTGIKEKEEEGVSFEELTNLLRPLIEETKGQEVRLTPKIVVEIAYEEIQKSTNYESGFALRFPRLITIRYDLGTKDAKTIDDVKKIYELQRGRNK